MQNKKSLNIKDVQNAKLTTRIKKIQGQVKALVTMIENGRNCEEVIQQIIAARAALASLGIEVILESNTQCELGKIKSEEMKQYLTNIFKLS